MTVAKSPTEARSVSMRGIIQNCDSNVSPSIRQISMWRKFGKPTPYEGGVRWVLEECPWHEEHSDGPGGSAIFLRNGIIGFDCKHAHCQERTIRDVLGAVNGDGHRDDSAKQDPKKFDRMA